MATGQLAPLLHYLRTVTTPGASADIPDAELLSRFCRLRDEAAFTALVRRHGPMVLAVCRRVLRDEHTAEDAFQATFLVLARKAGSLARPELLGNWLHGVAYRTAVRAKAEAGKRRTHEQQAVLSQEIAPDDDFIWRDLRAVLDEEINRLPNRYRVPVVLCYLQGQTNAEAARRLGCSRGTVATLLARAREKLRRRLTQRGVGLSVGVALTALVETARGGAVSRTLEHVTAKAATLLAAGQTQAVGALAVHAVALAKGVSKGMLMEKLKIPVAILMMTAVVGTGAGITAYRARPQERGFAESEVEAKSRPRSKTEGPRKHVTAPAEQPKDRKATLRTANFLVTAPTAEMARQVGEAAEYNRKALARLWLNKELPAWDKPCPVRVTVTDKTTSSSSMFAFDNGEVSRHGMILEGSLVRIFADLLPHEMTHTILAEWRGWPLPRWADEGAATLSESAVGRATYEQAMERFLRKGHPLPLTELLPKFSYPRDVGAFYAQSHSLTDFLISSGGRKKFLAFVAQGEGNNWNKAAHAVYGYKSVKELEQAWLEHARKRLADKRSDEALASRQEVSVAPENRQPKPRPAPAQGEALANFSFQGKLPVGSPPLQMLVILSADGRLEVRRKVVYYQPLTKTVHTNNAKPLLDSGKPAKTGTTAIPRSSEGPLPRANGVIAGQVLSESTGRPVKAYILVKNLEEEDSKAARLDVETSEAGYFTIPGLKVGGHYKLIARAKEGDKFISQVALVQPPKPSLLLRLKKEQTVNYGALRQVTSYQRGQLDLTTAYDIDAVRVYDTKGRRIDLKEIRQRLKRETLALVSADGGPVDPLHLRLLKKDTLIFVLPPQAARAVPGVPAAVPVPPQVVPPPAVDDPEKSIPPSGS